jgi:hypothetical protein
MKSVVMISYWFPPDGCAAVYRPLRFARHLPDAGWLPRIITADLDRYTCSRYDPELLSLVPSEIQVVRVGSRDLWQALQAWRARRNSEKPSVTPVATATRVQAAPASRIRSSLRKVVRKVEASCYHPDMVMGWIGPAVRETVELCSRHRPDVLWATAGPVSSFIVAERVSRSAGLPYVLDFRDSWTITYNEFDDNRPRWASYLDRQRMYKLLRNAHAVVFRFATEAECYWRLYRGALKAERIHLIPNGYEGPIEEFSAAKRERCHILYTGNVSDYRHDTLLEALRVLKELAPDQAKKLSILFVGEGSDVLCERSGAMGLANLITARDAVANHEVTRMTRAADALLILGRPPTMRGHELLAGAKLFGYLNAGRPIVGVLPFDETRKILERAGVSTIADADSVPEIVALIKRILHAWSGDRLASLLPDRAACEAYSAERQTAALARALEGQPAAEPFIPGTNEIPPSLKYQFMERWSEKSPWHRILSPVAK